MIGSIRGKIIHKAIDKIEVDTNGIGWEVFVSPKALTKIKINQEAELFTYHYVAEGTDVLYGFLSRQDKQVFKMLISVSGVGPRTAIEIFSAGNGERILKAVSEADVEFFKQVKGVGKKGAQRIIVDLKSKVGEVEKLDLKAEAEDKKVVYQALENLGFKRKEIHQALKDLPKDIKEEEEEIVKFALRRLGKGG